MNDREVQQLVSLLEDIRDGQKLYLERQAEALTLQREQFVLAKQQFERAEKLQDRAERLQARSAQLMGSARKVFLILVPIVIALIAYVSWLLLV